jgi:hypothetical protein
MTTPTDTSPESNLTGSGAPALSQTARPALVPVLTRAVEPSTAPVASLMNVAWADLGFVSGIPTGSDPALVSTWLTDTRACALMKSTSIVSLKNDGRNHGRSVSVSLTSSIPAAHGLPSTVSSAVSGWL